MSEERMKNPYEERGKVFVAKAINGGRQAMGCGDDESLSSRLQRMAFYLTENQQTAGDAMFIWDLHSAIKIVRKSEEASPTTEGSLIAPEPAEQKLSTESSFLNTRPTEAAAANELADFIEMSDHLRAFYLTLDDVMADKIITDDQRSAIVNALRTRSQEGIESCQGAEIERLRDMLDNRNEFIAQHGLWKELGKYLSEPEAALIRALSSGSSVIEKQMGPDTLPAIEGGERASGLGAPLESASEARIAELEAGLRLIREAGAVHGGAWCVAQANGYLESLDYDQWPDTGKPPSSLDAIHKEQMARPGLTPQPRARANVDRKPEAKE